VGGLDISADIMSAVENTLEEVDESSSSASLHGVSPPTSPDRTLEGHKVRVRPEDLEPEPEALVDEVMTQRMAAAEEEVESDDAFEVS
jgi:hypothetical protein